MVMVESLKKEDMDRAGLGKLDSDISEQTAL